MTEKENELIPRDQNLPAAEEASGKKPGLVRGARDFIENTFQSLKGKDMNQAVEEFTSEMTLVVEGLSEDQNTLRRDVDSSSAQLTMLEEKVLRQEKDRKADVSDLQEELKQAKKRLDSLEKTLKEAEKKPQKMGLGQILRQATWMVGILCVSWIVVTVLKLIGR
ncbi:MAG: hypothetical protein IJU12_09920 [Clostridia bacterium]|nr:hypothetical protein [Clostridia bacterium]